MVVTKLSVFVEAFNSLTLNRPSKSRLYASPSVSIRHNGEKVRETER